MKMRKLHILALVFLAVACGREDFSRVMPDAVPGFENIEAEDNCIILKLDAANVKPVTRASATERGLDSLNENRISSIDCFFFKTGETDSPAIFRAIGRTVEDAVSDSTECYVKVYYNDDIAEVLFGDTSNGTCEAFVIANAAINYNVSSTLNELRQSVLEYDFSQQEVQPYFTMCSRDTAQVTLYSIMGTVNGRPQLISTAAGRVPLYRCAAKSQLYLKLPETFTDGVDPCIYAPCPDSLGGLQVRLHSGIKKTYADGRYPYTSSDYIHYSDRTMYRVQGANLIQGKEDFNYSHRPFYSYPMTWTDLDDNAANFIFSIPWHMVKDADGNTVDGPAERRYYKMSANVIGRKFEANSFYRTFIYIQSRGEEDLDAAEELPECWYLITDWVHEGLASGSGSESISGEFIRYNFLVVEPDEAILNNDSTYTFKFKSSSDMKDYKVVIDSVCFYKYNSGQGVRRQIAVGDSRTTAAQRDSGNGSFIDKNEYSVTYNYAAGEIYFKHTLDEVYEQRDIYLTVTNRDNISQSVKIHQKPAIMLTLRSGGNLFVDGYYAHVVDASDQGVGRLGGISVGNGANRYYHSANQATGNNTYGNSAFTSTSYIVSPYSYIINALSSTMPLGNLTEIHVSAFSSNYHSYTLNGVEYEYRIGDPRVPSGWSASNLVPYLVSQSRRNNTTYNLTTAAWGDKAGQIMLTTQDRSKNNLIAPAFYIGSGWAAIPSTNAINWQNSLKKCATYQEAGYPAGRWRLPTEAELMFIFDRQEDGTIPALFNATADYWVASGWYYQNGTLHQETSATATHTPRCIYDLWYWGDEPMTEYEYHAGPYFD